MNTAVFLPELRINAALTGPEHAPALVLLHGPGLNMTIWDALVAALPHHRILRFDMRGHGRSDVPPAPYSMGALIRDSERLIEHFNLRDTVVLGHSLGGMVAQGLAVKRLDLVRGLIISNSAARIGIAPHWQERIALVRDKGMSAISAAMIARWFARNHANLPEAANIRAMFENCSPEGWMGAASAISGTDFYETTAKLRLPALFIAGANDDFTPSDLMRDTADLIPGHQFTLIRGAGHLPMIERPHDYAICVKAFLHSIGHI